MNLYSEFIDIFNGKTKKTDCFRRKVTNESKDLLEKKRIKLHK